jgi:hypothetical protein
MLCYAMLCYAIWWHWEAKPATRKRAIDCHNEVGVLRNTHTHKYVYAHIDAHTHTHTHTHIYI